MLTKNSTPIYALPYTSPPTASAGFIKDSPVNPGWIGAMMAGRWAR
jgi:hypothetical protein